MTQRHHKDANRAHAGPGKPTAPAEAAIAASDKNHNGKMVSDEAIRLCAYQKWEAAGKPAGDGVSFWLEAEQELLDGNKEKFVPRDGWPQHPEDQRFEAAQAVKAHKVNQDSHYRDNNRMFQSHGERGHRHDGNG